MEKSEVVKALECCSENMCQGCKCPYYKFRSSENDNCLEKMALDALLVIDSLETTILEKEEIIKNMDLEILVRRETTNKYVLDIVDYAVEKITEARNGS